jgi:hypothetical protein
MESTALYYALSTIAQYAAALAALIGFFGLWQLDRLRKEREQVEKGVLGKFATMGMVESLCDASTERRFEEAQKFLDSHPQSNSHRQTQGEMRPLVQYWRTLTRTQAWMMGALSAFLVVTLVVILTPAIIGLVFVNELRAWGWTPWLLCGAGTGAMTVTRSLTA